MFVVRLDEHPVLPVVAHKPSQDSVYAQLAALESVDDEGVDERASDYANEFYS